MAHTPPGRTRERVLRFVRERLLAGSPPTLREVQEAFGFRAVESARSHLTALVEAGLLEHAPGQARGWRLPSRGARAPVLVPILGRVQAGALTTAVEEPEGEVAVQARVPSAELFALRVRGDSMRGAGILDGDLVVVRRQETADDGAIVVALVGDEATVKRLRIRRDAAPRGTGAEGAHGAVLPGSPAGTPPRTPCLPRIELHPENPDFPVIVPPPGEARVLGRVIEVRRHLDTESRAPWESSFPGAPAAVPRHVSESRARPAGRPEPAERRRDDGDAGGGRRRSGHPVRPAAPRTEPREGGAP